jgi:hypothetical protein
MCCVYVCVCVNNMSLEVQIAFDATWWQSPHTPVHSYTQIKVHTRNTNIRTSHIQIYTKILKSVCFKCISEYMCRVHV